MHEWECSGCLPDYPVPDWLYEGQEVIAPYQGATGVKCKVLVAAGDAARVVNEKRGIDRWYSRYALRVHRPVKAEAEQ